MPVDLIGRSLGYTELHPYFPKASLCQTWKTGWLSNKLANSSETALHSLSGYDTMNHVQKFGRLEKSHAVHLNLRPLLDNYKDIVNLNLQLGKKGSLVAPENIAKVDSVIKKTNDVCSCKRDDRHPLIVHEAVRGVAVHSGTAVPDEGEVV